MVSAVALLEYIRRLVVVGSSLIELLLLLEKFFEVVVGDQRNWMRLAQLATTTVERLAVQRLGVGVLALIIEQDREIVDRVLAARRRRALAQAARERSPSPA